MKEVQPITISSSSSSDLEIIEVLEEAMASVHNSLNDHPDSIASPKIPTPNFRDFLLRYSANSCAKLSQTEHRLEVLDEEVTSPLKCKVPPKVVAGDFSLGKGKLGPIIEHLQTCENNSFIRVLACQSDDFLSFSIALADKDSPQSIIIKEASEVYRFFEGQVNPDRLTAFLAPYRPIFQTHIFVYGCRGFSSSLTAEINKEFKKCLQIGGRLAKQSSTRHRPPWADFERDFWNCCMFEGIKVTLLEKLEYPSDIVLAICKKLVGNFLDSTSSNVNGVNFCMEAMKNSGSSHQDTWMKMLQEIGRVTLPTSQAIVSKYPTLSSLMQAYERMTEAEAEHLLETLQVNNRSLGPVLSRRIYRLLTSSTPNILANL